MGSYFVGEVTGQHMGLSDILRVNGDRVMKQCFRRFAETYPPETAHFIQSETDPFQNPVGHTMKLAMERLLAELIGEGSPEGFRQALDGLVRIRATQTASASEALCFMSLLREAVREEVEGELRKNGAGSVNPEEYLLLEDRFHRATLIARDLFVVYRKKIDEIRTREVKAEKERLERLIRAAEDGSREGKKRAGNQRSEVGKTDCETRRL